MELHAEHGDGEEGLEPVLNAVDQGGEQNQHRESLPAAQDDHFLKQQFIK